VSSESKPEVCGIHKLMKSARCSSTDVKIYAYDPKGVLVPLCMRHWLRYAKSEPEIDALVGGKHVHLKR